MGRYARSRTHKGRKAFSKSIRTRRRQRDLDQIHSDLVTLNKTGSTTLHESLINEDVAGGGMFPCVHCARHFIDKVALGKHLVSKLHKKRVKVLEKNAPYSVKEAEAAGGLGTYYHQTIINVYYYYLGLLHSLVAFVFFTSHGTPSSHHEQLGLVELQPCPYPSLNPFLCP